MEAAVHGVVHAHHSHIPAQRRMREKATTVTTAHRAAHDNVPGKTLSPDHFGLKEELLPGPAEMIRAIHHRHPVLPVQRYLFHTQE